MKINAKSITAFGLTVVLLVLQIFSATAADIVYGDADGDKQITADDARTVLRIAVGLEDLDTRYSNERTLDVDVDGDITASDARLILRYAVMLLSSLPCKGGDPSTEEPQTYTLSTAGQAYKDHIDAIREKYGTYDAAMADTGKIDPKTGEIMCIGDVDLAFGHITCHYCGRNDCISLFENKKTLCPEYSIYKDPIFYCQICGRHVGDGSNGTCCRYVNDTYCPICGAFVAGGTCHTCGEN